MGRLRFVVIITTLVVFFTTEAFAMKQVIISGTDEDTNAASTTYGMLIGDAAEGFDTSEEDFLTAWPAAGTMSDLIGALGAQPDNGAGVDSYTLTIRESESTDTSMAVTISDTDTTGSDSNTHTTAQGDFYTLELTPANSPAIAGIDPKWSFYFEPTTDGESVVGGAGRQTSQTGLRYVRLFGSTSSLEGTENQSQMPIPDGGTLRELHVRTEDPPNNGGGTQEWVITVQINGSDGNSTCSVSEDSDNCSDLTNTDTLSAGDVVSFEVDPNGTPQNFKYISVSAVIDFTTADAFMFGWGTDDLVPLSGTEYMQPSSSDSSWSATEGDRQQVTKAMRVLAAYCSSTDAPGTGDSYTYTLNDDGTGTGAAVTLSEAETADNVTGLSIDIAEGSLLSIAGTASGSPGNAIMHCSYLAQVIEAGGASRRVMVVS
jgi:hypothetical protein